MYLTCMSELNKPQSVEVDAGYAEFRELREGDKLILHTKTSSYPLVLPDVKYLPQLFFVGLKLSEERRESNYAGPVAIAGLGNLDLVETEALIRFGDAVTRHIAMGYLLDFAWIGFPKPARGTPAFQAHLQNLKKRFSGYLPHIFELAFDPMHATRWVFRVNVEDSRNIGYSSMFQRIVPPVGPTTEP